MLGGNVGLVARVLRALDDEIATSEAAILNGGYATLEDYKAACATRRTWADARAIVVRTYGADQDD